MSVTLKVNIEFARKFGSGISMKMINKSNESRFFEMCFVIQRNKNSEFRWYKCKKKKVLSTLIFFSRRYFLYSISEPCFCFEPGF